ncbi:MAG: response regulator [Bryobacterales bacterium]
MAFRSGDKQTARDLLTEAAGHNPENELVWLWRASAARTRGEAFEAVSRVLDINPENEKALKWIEKLRPINGATQTEQNHVHSSNGSHALVQESEKDESADVEEAAHAPEQSEEQIEAETDRAGDEERIEAHPETESVEETAPVQREEEAPEETATAVEEREDESEPVREEAEDRLAALEADLGLSGERLSRDNARDNRHIEGYGWGLAAEERAEVPSGEDDSDNDVWGRLTQAIEEAQQEEQDDEQESNQDPLVALLDDRQRTAIADEQEEEEQEEEESAVTEELETEAASAPERPAPVGKPRPQERDEEDVWASLGMAGMGEHSDDEEPQPLAKAAAAGADEDLEVGMADVSEAVQAAATKSAEPATPDYIAPDDEDEEETACFICEKYAQPQEGFCSACRAIVDLKLLDSAPRHEGADRAQLIAALDRVREKIADDPSPKHYVRAALVCLNLRQSQQALGYLREACRLRPHDHQLVGYYDKLEKRPLILAVDDSKTVQKMISTVLEKESYRVLQAEDGLSALAKLDEEMPALILLDITMPRMDGYQVCKVITGNDATKHIPVIMLSGKDGFFDKVRGKMVGASNYITKPFDPNELTKTIGKFLKKN